MQRREEHLVTFDCAYHLVPLGVIPHGANPTTITMWCAQCQRHLGWDELHARQCTVTAIVDQGTLQCGLLEGHEVEHGEWVPPMCRALIHDHAARTFFRCELDERHPGAHRQLDELLAEPLPEEPPPKRGSHLKLV